MRSVEFLLFWHNNVYGATTGHRNFTLRTVHTLINSAQLNTVESLNNTYIGVSLSLSLSDTHTHTYTHITAGSGLKV